jgi:hypothetical protein
MGSQSSKAKYEKMVSELGYLEADLEYHQAIMNESQIAFEEALDETAKKKGVNLNRGKPKSKKGPPPQRSTKKNKKKKPRKKTKDLYKKIASAAHPDKLLDCSDEERERKKKLFVEASKALEEDMVLTLHRLAKEVGIDPGDLDDEDLEMFKVQIEELKTKISQLESTWIWAWINAEEEQQKDHIIEKFLESLLTAQQQEDKLEEHGEEDEEEAAGN